MERIIDFKVYQSPVMAEQSLLSLEAALHSTLFPCQGLLSVSKITAVTMLLSDYLSQWVDF